MPRCIVAFSRSLRRPVSAGSGSRLAMMMGVRAASVALFRLNVPAAAAATWPPNPGTWSDFFGVSSGETVAPGGEGGPPSPCLHLGSFFGVDTSRGEVCGPGDVVVKALMGEAGTGGGTVDDLAGGRVKSSLTFLGVADDLAELERGDGHITEGSGVPASDFLCLW